MADSLRTDYDRIVGESYKEYAARMRGRMLAAERDRDAHAAKVRNLKQERDWLLGRLLDVRANRWVNERLGEFSSDDLDAMLAEARADLRRRCAAPDDEEMGGPDSVTAGYFRRFARGEE